ncbi:MAG: ABC transporter permease subunit [Elusimicrobiota bacterium]
MSALWTLLANSWREQLRGRFFPVSLIFGGVILYMSALLGILAADQELRVLLDFGLSAIEIMVCGAVAFTAATGLLQEIETKTVYLILTRPVSKSAYLTGRFLGGVSAAVSATLIMALIHLSLLWLKGWAWSDAYAMALAGVILKALVTAAVATLLALISTSVLSALLMTGIVWVLGHFIMEIRFLVERGAGSAAKTLAPLIYVLPNLQILNFRDRLHVPEAVLPGEPLVSGLLYAVVYSAACMAFTLALFRRREF